MAGRPLPLAGARAGGDDGGYFESFDVPVGVEVRPGTAVSVDGAAVAADDLPPRLVLGLRRGGGRGGGRRLRHHRAGARGRRLQGDRRPRGRSSPSAASSPRARAFADSEVERRYGDLRYKAFNAREHGAKGVIVVDSPAPSSSGAAPAAATAEAPLPALGLDAIDAGGDVGIPAVSVKRAAGSVLFAGAHRASLQVDLERRTKPAANVVGLIRAGAADRLPGALVVGAHYDHLGHGGTGSLAPDSHEIHNGADDNASGTAALLEVARQLAAERSHLRRDVYLIAFSGEEEGTLGSTAFTRHPTAHLKTGDLVAMLNMDMVGRLRGNKVAVLGGESAAEWKRDRAGGLRAAGARLRPVGRRLRSLRPQSRSTPPACRCSTSSPAPTRTTTSPRTTPTRSTPAGGARVAALVADVAAGIADRPERPTYKSAPAPAPQGDVRSYGASLGTVPDYAGDGRPGVLLSGVRPGSAADQGGLRRGDLLVGLAGKEIRDIHDFMYVLQRAKPGEKATAVVVRDGKKVELDVTFGGKK